MYVHLRSLSRAFNARMHKQLDVDEVSGPKDFHRLGGLFPEWLVYLRAFQSKKDSKDHGSMQSRTTLVPGYQMGK